MHAKKNFLWAKKMQIPSEKIYEEVEFWIDFIARWKDEHNKPATPRMLEALDNSLLKVKEREIKELKEIKGVGDK